MNFHSYTPNQSLINNHPSNSFSSRLKTRGNHLPHAKTPAHRRAFGDLQLGGHAVHGVRIVSTTRKKEKKKVSHNISIYLGWLLIVFSPSHSCVGLLCWPIRRINELLEMFFLYTSAELVNWAKNPVHCIKMLAFWVKENPAVWHPRNDYKSELVNAKRYLALSMAY